MTNLVSDYPSKVSRSGYLVSELSTLVVAVIFADAVVFAIAVVAIVVIV